MADKLTYIQEGFSDGMQLRVDATRISRKAYPIAVNARNRNDLIAPVREPLNVPLPEQGNLQGCYAAGNYLLIFVNGRAWVRNYFVSNPQWTPIIGFQMDEDQPVLWAELVPASGINFGRFLSGTDASGDVNLRSLLSSSPRCVIVNDGINQPRLILSNGTCRVSKAFAEWTPTDGGREYLPIGRQMLHFNGKLYMVSRDALRIYHSVSGRPLDFMVNIDATGNAGGDADSTSHAVGYSEISCLAPLAGPDGGFYVGTVLSSHKVVPDFSTTLFGEPQFDNVDLFPTGALNQFSFADVMGDSTIIDFTGVRSFNATEQFQVEGRNSPFSKDVAPLFEGVIQSSPCAGKFDNYALFGVSTVYGNGVLVRDELTESWVGLDMYTGIGAIRQFAEIKTPLARKLFFITSGNLLYEAFAGASVAPCKVYIGDWCSGDPAINQRQNKLNAVFVDVVQSGNVSATAYTDRKAGKVATAPLTATAITETTPKALPFGASTADNAKSAKFDIGRNLESWKTGFWLEWAIDAKLSHIGLVADPTDSEEGKAARYARNIA